MADSCVKMTTYLGTGDNTLPLYARNSLRNQSPRQPRVDREAFPVSASAYDTPSRANDGAKQDVDALCLELTTHGSATPESQVLAPATPVVSIKAFLDLNVEALRLERTSWANFRTWHQREFHWESH